jgi:hypothetical protein
MLSHGKPRDVRQKDSLGRERMGQEVSPRNGRRVRFAYSAVCVRARAPNKDLP